MPSNQNPVFTDNDTITGDGTVENPLVANIPAPTPGIIGGLAANSAAGPIVVTSSGSLQEVINSGNIALPASGGWRALAQIAFQTLPGTGATAYRGEFQRHSDASIIGFEFVEEIALADNATHYVRGWLSLGSDAWIDGDSVDFVASASGASIQFSNITISVMLIPTGF